MKPAAKSRTAKQPDRQRSSRSPAAELAGQIQLLRMRVVDAEATLKQARAQADQAKRRRKIAKLLAKRARKGAKQARVELQEVRAALARAEAAVITEIKPRAAKRKSRKSKTGGRSVAPLAKNRSANSRKRRTAARGKSPASGQGDPLAESVVPVAADPASRVPPTPEAPGDLAPETITETPSQKLL